MKTKFATLLALAWLVVGGNAKADVVGLTTNRLGNGMNNFVSERILTVKFNTTGLSGNRFTGISFASLGTVSPGATLFATLMNVSYGYGSVSSLSYVSDGAIINFDTGDRKIGSNVWDSNSSYELIVEVSDALTRAVTYSVDTPHAYNLTVTNNIPDWISSPSVSNGDVAFTLYTAVPEPGTMILTGTALAAGAVGAYFKRRRKAKAEVAA